MQRSPSALDGLSVGADGNLSRFAAVCADYEMSQAYRLEGRICRCFCSTGWRSQASARWLRLTSVPTAAAVAQAQRLADELTFEKIEAALIKDQWPEDYFGGHWAALHPKRQADLLDCWNRLAALDEERLALELSPEDLEHTKARLEAFKNLRNRIVHHLYEEHDLTSGDGCERALLLLDEGLHGAQANFQELQQWAKTAIEAQQHFAAFVQVPQFMEFLDGILPDGTVDWPSCTAVRLLRRQEETTPPGAMPQLDIAPESIRTSHPEDKPRKYFCQNWRERLKRSSQFHIRKEKGSARSRALPGTGRGPAGVGRRRCRGAEEPRRT